MDELQKKDLEYIWHPSSQMKDYESFPPIVVDHAEGINLYDVNGKCYKDIVSSWWCNLLGHSNSRINQAIKNQLDKVEHVIFANFTHEPAITLCEKLMEYLPKGLCKFNFADNGSASVEMALKMSFQYHLQTGKQNKKRFMTLTNAYHGETIAALAVGDCDLYTKLYKPLMLDVIKIEAPDCYRCKYGKNCKSCNIECFEKAEQAFEEFAKETSAIIVEPLLQGSAGMKIYPPLYLTKLRQLCDKYDVNLIADEIATGFGRTGEMFAFNHTDISPDIMCISKGLTGGYMPMSITITTQKIYDAFYADYLEGKAFMHSHTYAGNPLGCAAANEVLNIFKDENILEEVKTKAPIFNKMIIDKFSYHKNFGDIRNIGLIKAIELVEDKETKSSFDSRLRLGYQIYRKALDKGVLLRPLGDVLYFNPPLIFNEEDMEYTTGIALECLIEILGE